MACFKTFSLGNVEKSTGQHERRKARLAAVGIIQLKGNDGLDQDDGGIAHGRW